MSNPFLECRDTYLTLLPPGSSDINLRSMLYHASFKDPPNVQLFVNSIPDLARPKFADAVKGDFRRAKIGETFGPSWV